MGKLLPESVIALCKLNKQLVHKSWLQTDSRLSRTGLILKKDWLGLTSHIKCHWI